MASKKMAAIIYPAHDLQPKTKEENQQGSSARPTQTARKPSAEVEAPIPSFGAPLKLLEPAVPLLARTLTRQEGSLAAKIGCDYCETAGAH